MDRRHLHVLLMLFLLIIYLVGASFFFCSAKIDIYYYEKVPEVLEIQLLIENKHVDLVNTETQAITPMTVTCI